MGHAREIQGIFTWCVIYTDNPLSHLSTAKLGATEQRWAAQLVLFDFDIKYHSGKNNKNADALPQQHPPAVQDLENILQAAVTALPHQTFSDI